MNRRSLLIGIGSALAAPAIVKAENLMKIAAVRQSVWAGDPAAWLRFVEACDQADALSYVRRVEFYGNIMPVLDAATADVA